MKKSLSIMMAFVFSSSLMMSATAADFTASGADVLNDASAVRYYAYMDLDKAEESLKDDILQARDSIIFSTGWVTEGVRGVVEDKDGNVIEELPQFYDLFPSDWEVPTVSNSSLEDAIQPQRALDRGTEVDTVYDGTVTLQTPTDGIVSPAFCKVTTSWSNYTITKIDTIGFKGDSAKYNASYTNTATKKSLGYKNNLQSGTSFSIYPPKNIQVGVHASSSTDPGEWAMQVYSHINY